MSIPVSALSSLSAQALRLSPGTDLREALETIAQQENLGAAFVLAAVGSLSPVVLRFAGRSEATTLEGKHEILTLSGLISLEGLHVHMSVADARGQCWGGHLMAGSRVYTTCELVIGLLEDLRFQRLLDPFTGFRELVVRMGKLDSSSAAPDDYPRQLT